MHGAPVPVWQQARMLWVHSSTACLDAQSCCTQIHPLLTCVTLRADKFRECLGSRDSNHCLPLQKRSLGISSVSVCDTDAVARLSGTSASWPMKKVSKSQAVNKAI